MNTLTERKLSFKQRKRLSRGSFVFPKERRYPIEDKAHARNALARVAQHGTPSEKKKVNAAVHRKFPGIGKKKATRESLQQLDEMLPYPPKEEMAEIS